MSPPREFPRITKMFGIELEFFLLDNEGKISNNAEIILEKLKKQIYRSDLKKECGHSMIELVSFPHISSRYVFRPLFDDFETLLYTVDTEDLRLFCNGTYPGKNTNKMREDPRYTAKKNILGEKNFQKAGHCIGFHYHYSLPRKSFNHNINFFYPDISKKNKNKVLNMYNLFIALDPAITTFMQSSPYYEGHYLGKDARMIVYRGHDFFSYHDALYSKQPEFGTLNEYEHDFKNLTENIKTRFLNWKNLLKMQNMTFDQFIKKEPSILDSSWKPVKMSAHGTIESRGADMNSPSKIVAMSSLMKSLTKFINKNSIDIIPSHIGNTEPFKIEDNIMHIPESRYLIETLQKNSAQYGFDSNEVYSYCQDLLINLKKNISKEKYRPIKEFENMIESKKTTSDKIIDFVKKRQGDIDEIDDQLAQDMALYRADKLYKDLLIAKKTYETEEY